MAVFTSELWQKDVRMNNIMEEAVFYARCYFISCVALLFLVLYCLTLIVTRSLTLVYCITQALSSYSFKDTFQYKHWFLIIKSMLYKQSRKDSHRETQEDRTGLYLSKC